MENIFPEFVVLQAWYRSQGSCECELLKCIHQGQCGSSLVWNYRGVDIPGGWEAHHRDSTGLGTLANCQILCQPCHKNTESYGG